MLEIRVFRINYSHSDGLGDSEAGVVGLVRVPKIRRLAKSSTCIHPPSQFDIDFAPE